MHMTCRRTPILPFMQAISDNDSSLQTSPMGLPYHCFCLCIHAAGSSTDVVAEPCLTVHMCCMQEHTCYCRPCRPGRDTHHHQYGLLGATAFTIIIAVVPALVVLGCLSLCLYLFQRHSQNKQLLPPMIPFSELKLSAESDVLFQGTCG